MDLRQSPERRLIMTATLHQSLHILQMPQLELAQWLSEQIEQNPLLEPPATFSCPLLDHEIEAPPSLFDHLTAQIRELFSSPYELEMAHQLLHLLDEKGFIEPPLPIGAAPILTLLQTLDPPGIFATSLQESLLLQLQRLNLSDSPAYLLIRDFFDDLLHGRYATIKKTISDLGAALTQISQLNFRPADVFHRTHTPTIFPDLVFSKTDTTWTVALSNQLLFPIQVTCYDTHSMNGEEKEIVRSWSTSAKWICRCLERRKKTLLQLGALLVRKQNAYLSQSGPLRPLTVQAVASQLGMHESTLSRALADKYAQTPRGLIPLRSLFTASPKTQSAKQLLQELIGKEEAPLTDAELARRLAAQGLTIARRTIAKYRKQLKISSTKQRCLREKNPTV